MDEIREQATRDWRAYQVDARAREVLEQVRKDVKTTLDALPASTAAEARADAARQALVEGAQKAGLKVRQIVDFNNDTTRRTPPLLSADGPVAPELRAGADDIRSERFVMDRYRDLAGIESSAFLPVGVLLDAPSEAAYLILLDGKRKPDRFEANETSLENARRQLRAQEALKIRESLGYEALAARFKLEQPNQDASDDEDESARTD
jgi:hypothetical protein